jgi:HSP20 family protein
MLYPTIWNRQTPNLWEDIFNIRNEFDRVLGRSEPQVNAGWNPFVDVRETKDALELKAELPGVTIDDVDVSVENGVLTIAGEKKQQWEQGTEGSGYHLLERRYGRFERRFTLPRSVDADKVSAHFDHGVLSVTLPKVEKAKPRRIDVKVGVGK